MNLSPKTRHLWRNHVSITHSDKNGTDVPTCFPTIPFGSGVINGRCAATQNVTKQADWRQVPYKHHSVHLILREDHTLVTFHFLNICEHELIKLALLIYPDRNAMNGGVVGSLYFRLKYTSLRAWLGIQSREIRENQMCCLFFMAFFRCSEFHLVYSEAS